MQDYHVIAKIGEGTFGQVFKAQHIESGRIVALKVIRIKSIQDGIPKTVFREINALQHIEHPHVVPLFEHFPNGSSVVLSFEYMLTDLFQIMRCLTEQGKAIPENAIKTIMMMTLQGVNAIHEANIIHRDIKPGNLLISTSGRLKIGDFGLARIHVNNKKGDTGYGHSSSSSCMVSSSSSTFSSSVSSTTTNCFIPSHNSSCNCSINTPHSSEADSDIDKSQSINSIHSSASTQSSHLHPHDEFDNSNHNENDHDNHNDNDNHNVSMNTCIHASNAALYSHEVATRWYRAPELLYGTRKYGFEVDLWAVGCVFGEMLNNSPLFAGENDIDQIFQIVQTLGTLDETKWKGSVDLPDFHKISFSEVKPSSLSKLLPDASSQAIALLEKFLVYDPSLRISAKEALQDRYFFTEPLPVHPSELLSFAFFPLQKELMKEQKKKQEELDKKNRKKALKSLQQSNNNTAKTQSRHIDNYVNNTNYLNSSSSINQNANSSHDLNTPLCPLSMFN
jgi:cell cycle related kinase